MPCQSVTYTAGQAGKAGAMKQAWLRLLPHLEAQPPNILFVQTTTSPVIALAEHSMACDVILHGPWSRRHSILTGSESMPYGSRPWVAILVMIAIMVWLGGWAGPAGEAGAVLVRAALVAVAQPLDDLLHSRLWEDAHAPALQPLQLIKGRQDAAQQSTHVSHIPHTLNRPYQSMSLTTGSCSHARLSHCRHSAQQRRPRCCTGGAAGIDSPVWADDAVLGQCYKRLGTLSRRQARRRRSVPLRRTSVMQSALQKVGLIKSGTGAVLESQGSGDK